MLSLFLGTSTQYLCLSDPGLLAIGFGLPDNSAGKESTCSAGNLGLIPALERCPGEGNVNPLLYSYLENSSLT